MRTQLSALVSTLALALTACGGPDVGSDTQVSNGWTAIEEGSAEETAVLALVNDAAVDVALLDDDVGLDSRAAANIVDHRNGGDGQVATSDDNPYDSISELDGISYVGASALDKLLAYAIAHGYMPGSEAPTEEQIVFATLMLAQTADMATLDDAVGLDRRAAENIVAWRAGNDGIDQSADDRHYMSLAALDDISYVGSSALAAMRDYAVGNGYLELWPTHTAEVIFSPQQYYQSHITRVVGLIDAAQHSIDIAMYSYSDAAIQTALANAVARGVSVRFLFDTASEDRKLSGSALASSKSGKLEQIGVDVRWVNKIMHHKFAIIDGPRDDLGAAANATVVTGSGNWSYGAATKYDENTLFLHGQAELTLELQREFNHLWDHSRDFVHVSLPFVGATAIDAIDDDASVDAFFTSDNFSVTGDTFRISTGKNTVSDAMVEAIETATDSIWIASGHLRSRPISEALMAKAAAHPEMDIRIYADGQEYISSWYQAIQEDELSDCLVAAGTSAAQQRNCYDKGFLFGYQLGQSGVAVRYKFYAYRWDYSYAPQMHHKVMIIDGDELWTGSYNQSDNAEHNTFENVLVFRGLPFADLIAAYQDNYESLWTTRRDDGTYQSLLETVQTAQEIPLVFDAMALDHAEIAALKDLIADNCPAVHSDPYKDEPQNHLVCPR